MTATESHRTRFVAIGAMALAPAGVVAHWAWPAAEAASAGSDMTPNLTWELALLRDRHALARTVFIAHERQAAAAAASLVAQRGEQVKRSTLLTYGDPARADVRKERAAIAASLTGGHITSSRA